LLLFFFLNEWPCGFILVDIKGGGEEKGVEGKKSTTRFIKMKLADWLI
jgi:hypothetical protein